MWIRTCYPRWFQKYNYLVGAGVLFFSIYVYAVTHYFAALDGGTQVMVFILSFAVQGAAGSSHLFPTWWGANQGGNYDRCLYID